MVEGDAACLPAGRDLTPGALQAASMDPMPKHPMTLAAVLRSIVPSWASCTLPANNWGEKPGGFDLSSFKRVTFWARGEEGGEKIAEFKVGGITGEHGDSDSASIGPVTLTHDWKKYTIDLADKNLSHIVGGFCWSASRDDNPSGFTLFLDEVRFEQ